jgi:hypothetical protein
MRARFTPFIGVGLGILVAGSLVLLSLLAQRVTLQPPSPPSVSPVDPWRQPGASVELDFPQRLGGPIATLLEQPDRNLRPGRQPNRLLTLVAEAQNGGSGTEATTAPDGSGLVVALADGGQSATPTRRPDDRGPTPGSGGDDNDPARRDDEDEEEPPDDSQDDDSEDDYAREESDDSDDGSVKVGRHGRDDHAREESGGSHSDSVKVARLRHEETDHEGSGSGGSGDSGSDSGSGSDS